MNLLPQPVVASNALVLRTWPTGETSVIASLLTAGFGFVRVVAKAARLARSSLRPLVQPGRLVGVEISLNPRRELQYLRGGNVLLDPLATAATLERSAYLLAALELVDRCRPAAEWQGKLFAVCEDFVEVLSCAAPGSEVSLFYAFELALLELQGVAPALDCCAGCGMPLPASTCAGLWFSPAMGGVMCGRCGVPNAGARVLSPDVLMALRQLATRRGGQGRTCVLHLGAVREVGVALHKFLAYHLPGYRLPRALELLRSSAP